MITVIDTETAGFSGPIMQVAYQCHDQYSFEDKRTYKSLIRHDDLYQVHPDAFTIHGLEFQHCQSWGIGAKSVLEDVVSELAQATLIVGHNLSFDLRMIAKDCKRYGVAFDFTMTDPRMVCTMARTKEFCNLKDVAGKQKRPSLSELHYRLFCEDFQGAHDALADVRATARCYFELRKRGVL